MMSIASDARFVHRFCPQSGLMVRKINFQWNLRQLMAAHDLWKTTELIPLLRRTGRQPVRDPGLPTCHGQAGPAVDEDVDRVVRHLVLHPR